MYFYRICRRQLKSNMPLPELPESESAAADCSFQMLPGSSPVPEAQTWIQQWQQPDGTPWSSLSRHQGHYLVRFHGMADFLLSDDGAHIRCYPVGGTPEETLRHLLLDQVIPMALSRQGNLVLHCSAVVTPQGAVGFAGETGMGKSTLTASFCRSGFPQLTDDGLLVEEQDGKLVGFPSYPGLRLWDDSLAAIFSAQVTGMPMAHYSSKVRVALGPDTVPFCSQPAEIRRIYCLALADAVSIEPIPPSERFAELVKQSYRLDDLKDQDRLRREFERLSRVVALPLLRRLSYPRDLVRLAEVQEAILQDIQQEDRS
ncbi:MAG: hypothetical protein ACRD2Y_16435 [Terriglobales bacterium]